MRPLNLFRIGQTQSERRCPVNTTAAAVNFKFIIVGNFNRAKNIAYLRRYLHTLGKCRYTLTDILVRTATGKK